jgi:hypothetical protein
MTVSELKNALADMPDQLEVQIIVASLCKPEFIDIPSFYYVDRVIKSTASGVSDESVVIETGEGFEL